MRAMKRAVSLVLVDSDEGHAVLWASRGATYSERDYFVLFYDIPQKEK